MDNGHATCHQALRGLHFHEIDAFTPSLNADIQYIGITFCIIDQLTHLIVDRHLGHAFSLDLEVVVGGIGEETGRTLVFGHRSRRVIDMQIEQVRVVLDSCG